MNRSLRTPVRLLFLCGAALLSTQLKAQLKIGNNPSSIQRSAILELESNKQGLLLTRLTSFADINTLNPPDGMVVYLKDGTPQSGLYVRQDNNWVRMASSSAALANWALKGNAGTNPLTDYIGTSDAVNLSIRAGGVEGISVLPAGNVQLKKVDAAANTDLQVLLIQTNGTVVQRALPKTAFSALKDVITTTASITNTTFKVTENTTTGAISIDAPIMNDPATQNYGFLSKADYEKLKNLTSGTGAFTVADYVAALAAGEEKRAAKITFDPATQKYTLQLAAASATQAGIVTAEAQTFAGDKTLNDKLHVKKAVTIDDALTVTAGGASIKGNTTFDGASTITGALTLPKADATAITGPYKFLVQGTGNVVESRSIDISKLENGVTKITDVATNTTVGPDVLFKPTATGDDFTITADGTAKSVSFNLPDAGADAGVPAKRGVVSTAKQSFAGNKSFKNNVTVGGVEEANSTLQVKGSISMAIREVKGPATTAVAEDDNTILADASLGAVTLTLPAPATANVGRIYTIKKIGTGDIEKEVTIQPGGTAKIEGGSDYKIYNDWTFVTVQTDGKNWYIIKK
ncbi:hypothetical protein KTO58_01485 [Chitinophaga pendula]|uniref:hypothetical protein n=1 Tax=Chitinophaga TaxID=79328 RepID=UPI000BB046AC|nr:MULTISPECIES: hypothetical protein [Chitinophaga]ASZ14466.1 hypothetical protein CK934_27735 [Chitinophaga sp. MD30]UCJ07877.1 hypothetical protein KTO58_01485 [Chitinophaga pendula]